MWQCQINNSPLDRALRHEAIPSTPPDKQLRSKLSGRLQSGLPADQYRNSWSKTIILGSRPRYSRWQRKNQDRRPSLHGSRSSLGPRRPRKLTSHGPSCSAAHTAHALVSQWGSCHTMSLRSPTPSGNNGAPRRRSCRRRSECAADVRTDMTELTATALRALSAPSN